MRDPGDNTTTTVLAVVGEVELVVGRIDARTPDLALVDLLLRTQMAARRRGWRIRLRDVPDELRALLQLVGLDETLALGDCGSGRFEARREAELGEQLGVDEVVERPDPTA